MTDRFSIWWDSLSEEERDTMTIEGAFRAVESLLVDATETIELVPAFAWTCNECGRDNWARCVSHVLDRRDPYDASLIRRIVGLDDGEDIPEGEGVTSMTHPTRVTCPDCKKTYRAVTPEHGAVADDD